MGICAREAARRLLKAYAPLKTRVKTSAPLMVAVRWQATGW